MPPQKQRTKKQNKTRELYALDPYEVSFVDDPANRKKFLVAKRRRALMDTVEQKVIEKMGRLDGSRMRRIDDAIKQLVRKAADSGDEGALSEEAQAALKSVARILAPYKDEISDADLDALQAAIGMVPTEPGDGGARPDEMADDVVPGEVSMNAEDDRDEGDDDEEPENERELTEKEADPPDDVGDDDEPNDDKDDDDEKGVMAAVVPADKPDGVDPEHHKEAMGAAGAAYTSALAGRGYKVTKAAKNEGAMPERRPDLTGFDPKQRQQVEAIFKRQRVLADENKTLVRKLAKLEDDLKVERDDRLTRQFEQRADEYRHLGAERGKVAQVLKRLKDAGHDDILAETEAILKAANSQVEKAQQFGGDLYGEIGSRLEDAGASTAEQKLQALVDTVVEKSAGAGKTRAQVYRQVLKSAEGRQLYKQSQTAKGEG